jgi:Bacterial archaeo-eukaryotic release factor family 10
VLLTHDAVRHIDALADALGVLSIFVGSRRSRDATILGQAVPLGRRLDRLTDLDDDPSPRERRAAVRSCLRRLRPRMTDLVTRSGGRGGALFAGLSSGDVLEVATGMPLPTAARLEPTGYVRPLVAALDEGEPAGVLLAHRHRVRLLDWRMGVLVPVSDGGFAARAAAASHAAEAAREHGWRRLVVDGDPLLAGSLLAGEAELRSCSIAVATRSLGRLSAPSLVQAVAAELESVQRRREVALVHDAVDASRRGEEAVLGVDQAARALTAGRVSHLLFDNDREQLAWPGQRLVEAGLSIDPAERLIELALDSAATITPVEGRAARALDSGDGVVGLLRW